tara:strand:- start:324 stop:722 length:399 start_codon:yes stop_codon:yes gene_type:complete
MGVKKVYISWDEVYDMLDVVAKKVSAKSVSGIPRGGSLLAILYSHRYNIEYRSAPIVGDPNQLIIDDIADSGETLKLWQKEFKDSIFATLHYKNISKVKPDIFAKEIEEDYGWIVYPWERKDSKTIQNYLDN